MCGSGEDAERGLINVRRKGLYCMEGFEDGCMNPEEGVRVESFFLFLSDLDFLAIGTPE